MEVSFVTDLWESPYLQQKKDELLREAQMNATIDAVSSGKVPMDETMAWASEPTPSRVEESPQPPIPLIIQEQKKPVLPVILSLPSATSSKRNSPSTTRQGSSSPELATDQSTVAASFPIKPRTNTKLNPNAPTIKCALCDNMIMATRLSNLTNHVRRHAFLKQYSCIYCEYNHNEMAKVRLHMLHNHKDGDNAPLDNLTPEMQVQWDMLMSQCFPGFDPKSLKGARSEVALQTCIECGEQVKDKHLEVHIQAKHPGDCHPFCCKSCGYENADEWKVRLHIIVRHAEEAAGTYPQPLPPDSRWGLYKKKFFPSLPGADEEEEELFTQLKEISRKDGKELGKGDKTKCQTCHKQIDFPNRSLNALLMHAKSHCPTKPYACSSCGFSSFVVAPIKAHIASAHHDEDKVEVYETELDELHEAWSETMLECYPRMEKQIKAYRLKGFKNGSTQLKGDDDEPPLKISRNESAILKLATSVLANQVAAS
ncbi:unnamed protein product, partial [Mesorhabditis spiculigera]